MVCQTLAQLYEAVGGRESSGVFPSINKSLHLRYSRHEDSFSGEIWCDRFGKLESIVGTPKACKSRERRKAGLVVVGTGTWKARKSSAPALRGEGIKGG